MTSQPTVAVDEFAGVRIGKYEVIRRLAIGGMAELFLARVHGIEGFQKIVVLKRILISFAHDPEFIKMFLDEARLAATLHHPNIVHVYDIGKSVDDYFFTMEYVHGEDLRRIMKTAHASAIGFPFEAIVAIATGIASGLHYAHEQIGYDGKAAGIVHRDVSPTNILVTYNGGVKIVDFGIAKAAASTHVTQAGTRKGKTSYMSPEQCKGDPVDGRSDIFAMGILLWEMVTLSRLFRGDSEFAVMRKIVEGDVPKPSTRRSDLPAELERIILKALQLDREDRYQTALDLQLDLERFAFEARIQSSAGGLAQYLRNLLGTKPYPWTEEGKAHDARAEAAEPPSGHTAEIQPNESPTQAPTSVEPSGDTPAQMQVAARPASEDEQSSSSAPSAKQVEFRGAAPDPERTIPDKADEPAAGQTLPAPVPPPMITPAANKGGTLSPAVPPPPIVKKRKIEPLPRPGRPPVAKAPEPPAADEPSSAPQRPDVTELAIDSVSAPVPVVPSSSASQSTAAPSDSTEASIADIDPTDPGVGSQADASSSGLSAKEIARQRRATIMGVGPVPTGPAGVVPPEDEDEEHEATDVDIEAEPAADESGPAEALDEDEDEAEGEAEDEDESSAPALAPGAATQVPVVTGETVPAPVLDPSILEQAQAEAGAGFFSTTAGRATIGGVVAGVIGLSAIWIGTRGPDDPADAEPAIEEGVEADSTAAAEQESTPGPAPLPVEPADPTPVPTKVEVPDGKGESKDVEGASAGERLEARDTDVLEDPEPEPEPKPEPKVEPKAETKKKQSKRSDDDKKKKKKKKKKGTKKGGVKPDPNSFWPG